MKKIAFLGGGNMAFALASSFYAQDNSLSFFVYDPDETRQQLFTTHFPQCTVSHSALEAAREAELIILAVKPQVIPTLLDSLEGFDRLYPGATVLSIAAGVPIGMLAQRFPQCSIVRLMPNTPCLVGEMAGAVAFRADFPAEKKEPILKLLRTAGTVICVKEEQMDAVTALSGSGPAFVARLIEAFIEAGEHIGLSAEDARLLTLTTFSGTARLLKEKNLSPEALVTMVSSPGGTTIAGREILEASSYRKIIQETLDAAALRSSVLGKQ